MARKKPHAVTTATDKDKKPYAYISAPSSADTSLLVDAVESRGLEVIRLSKLDAGSTIFDLLHKWMDRADYVIAVIGEKANPDVLYELGMASGMGKPILLLASRHGSIPAAAGGLSYLNAEPDNRKAIEFGLDQLLSTPKTRAIPRESGGRETHPIGAAADRFLRMIEAAGAAGTIREERIVEIISMAIKESGVSALSTGSPGEGRRMGDIAVWSADFEPWIGNPLIIEVKKSLNGRSDLERAIEQVSAMLNETRSPCGLLLYLGSKPLILYGGHYDLRVMVMSIEEFLDGLRDKGIGDLLWRARNEMVQVRS